MKKEFFSIKEFAAAAGVSQQSIYKRLNSENDELQQFLKIVDNKKYISAKALSAIYNINEQQEPPEFVTEENSNNNILDILKEQLEGQRKDIEDKNQQIKDLMERLAEANKIINQQQQLHLLDKQKILELESASISASLSPHTESKRKSIFSIFRKKEKQREE